MCVTEIYIDSYPDGAEVEFHRVKLCQYGYPEDPCDMHSAIEKPVRYIHYGEPTSEFIISQLRTLPRSSGSSQRPPSIVEVIDEWPSPAQPRQKRRPVTKLFMEALFPNSTRRRKERSRSRSRPRERVVVIDHPSPPRQIRTPPPLAIPPIYHEPRSFTAPMSPIYDSPDAPFIVEVSPTRGRQMPIIHDTSHRRRSTSLEFRYRASRQDRPRSPSPVTYDERRRQQRLQENRERRLRNEREARLKAEIEEEHDRRRREEFRTLHDAEINARPVRTFTSPATLSPRPRSILRPVLEQNRRRSSVIDDMGLSSRGERVIAEAIAERERAEERERLLRIGLLAEEEEAQRARLRRRFTVSDGAGSNGRRSHVVYDDGTYRRA